MKIKYIFSPKVTELIFFFKKDPVDLLYIYTKITIIKKE
jgi:hypothetical protein